MRGVALFIPAQRSTSNPLGSKSKEPKASHRAPLPGFFSSYLWPQTRLSVKAKLKRALVIGVMLRLACT